jgi:hypothetical protein
MRMRDTQVVLVNVLADTLSLTGARFLIESKMDPAIHARVVDVLDDPLEGGVLQDHARHGDVRERDVVTGGAVKPLEYLAGGSAGGPWFDG